MTDIGSIGAALTSIKTAIDIASALKKADVSLQQAELKLQIAELISALADAKINMVEIQEVIYEKNSEITRLKEALTTKEKLVRNKNAYYISDENNKPTGSPYCSHCWEVDNKPIHLHQSPSSSGKTVCPACKNAYWVEFTQDLEP